MSDLIDRRQQVALLQERLDVGQRQVGHRLPRLDGGAADVRQEHDVVTPEECQGDVRFIDEDIQAGARYRARLQGRDQCGLVDHGAAGDVDQEAVRSECIEHRGVDEVARAGTSRRSEHEDVAPAASATTSAT